MANVPKIPVCLSNDVGTGGKLLAVIGKILQEQSSLNIGGPRKPVYILNGQFVEGDGSANVQVTQKTTVGTHIASIVVDGVEYKIYNGGGSGGGTVENICVPLLTPLWFDHDPGDGSWLAASTSDLNVSTGAGFFTKSDQKKVYEHLLAGYNAAKAGGTKEASFPYPSESSPTTITYYETSDGHRICETSQVTKLNTLFNASSVGTAWFYVLDTANEKFSLPRTRYGFHGNLSYVKFPYAGENTMQLYFYNGEGPTSADKMDKVKEGVGPFTQTAVRDNVATFRDGGQVEDSGHKIVGSGALADSDLVTVNYLKTLLFDSIYPVGSVYIATKDYPIDANRIATNAGTGGNNFPFPGRWQKLTDGRCLWTAESNDQLVSGNVGAGLPNISGDVGSAHGYYFPSMASNSGAFSVTVSTEEQRLQGQHPNTFDGSKIAPDGNYGGNKISFSASRSNSIYGATSTVRPPSVPVTMWKRLPV